MPIFKKAPKPTPFILLSDQLFCAYYEMMPAERMMAGTGRVHNGAVYAGAFFDVTGVNHEAHVRAEPNKLGNALIAMDLSGTYFALWLHSHPGGGFGAAMPSQTDWRQHDDWKKDFQNPLLCAIVTRGGYVHFWGEAIETGKLEIKLIGKGVKPEGKSSDHNYRLYF